MLEVAQHEGRFQYLSRHLAQQVAHVQADVEGFEKDGVKALTAGSLLFRMSDTFKDLEEPLMKSASIHEQKMLRAMFSKDMSIDAASRASGCMGFFCVTLQEFRGGLLKLYSVGSGDGLVYFGVLEECHATLHG